MDTITSIGRFIGKSSSVFYMFIGIFIIVLAFVMSFRKVHQVTAIVKSVDCGIRGKCIVEFDFMFGDKQYTVRRKLRQSYKVGDKVQLYFQVGPNSATPIKPSRKLWYGIMSVGALIVLYNMFRYFIVSKSSVVAISQVV